MALQRPQIAALKALGYSNRDLAWHYLKWALVIAGSGAWPASAAAPGSARAMIGLYNEFFSSRPSTSGCRSASRSRHGVGLAAAARGRAVSAVRRAVRFRRPRRCGPRRRRGIVGASSSCLAVQRPLTQARVWCCATWSVSRSDRLDVLIGIAFAVAVLLVGFGFIDVIDVLLNEQFVHEHAAGCDRLASSSRCRRGRLSAVEHLPASWTSSRFAACRFACGLGIARARWRLPAAGEAAPEPHRRTVTVACMSLPPDGLVLSTILGRILDVSPGDVLQVEVLEGMRFVRHVRVAALVDDSWASGLHGN